VFPHLEVCYHLNGFCCQPEKVFAIFWTCQITSHQILSTQLPHDMKNMKKTEEGQRDNVAAHGSRIWLVALAAIIVAGVAIAFKTFFMRPEVVAGYVPDYRMDHVIEHISVYDGLVDDLILFSAIPKQDGTLDLSVLQLPRVRKLKMAAKGRHRLWLSIGGAGRSDAFPAIVAKKDLLGLFVANAVKVAQDEGFAGIDLDWEIPSNTSELEALIGEMARSCEKHDVLLSVAIHPWQEPPKHALMKAHRIHVMTYDLGSPHAPFEKIRSMMLHWKSKIDPKKMFLGIPMYSRKKGKPRDVLTHAEMVERDFPKNFDTNNCWETSRKSKFAQKINLGGIFFWELGQDTVDENSLLHCV